MNQQAKKDVYMGYVGEYTKYDSGVVKYPVSLKEEQLDEMKKYLTNSGNVNIDFVIKTDGSAFMSVFNPRAVGDNTQSDAADRVAQADADLPF